MIRIAAVFHYPVCWILLKHVLCLYLSNCCIDTLSVIPQYSTPTNKALSHGLQTLYVANDPTSLWDFNHLLLVTRHLYHMFPRLQTIDKVDGPNAEQ